jgi:hypothetical protein
MSNQVTAADRILDPVPMTAHMLNPAQVLVRLNQVVLIWECEQKSGNNLTVRGKLATIFQADHDRLLQAFLHLAKFMQLRSTHPSSLRLQAGLENSSIEISLIDAGPPLSENIRQHIFDRYRDFSLDSELGADGFHADLRLPLATGIDEPPDKSLTPPA